MKGYGLLLSLVCVAIVTFLSMMFNAPLVVFAAEVIAILILDSLLVVALFRRDKGRKRPVASQRRRRHARKGQNQSA
ncbi:hypothetical protein [Alicyclobacillus acidoterrestris]|uniref:Uncharacterized protein n=1 Tax=Alicyclobacillus acidoterrestris (strain ATCC 49025 / DSM 3922 / CIP 106132 / NCIMB 13137 / GD3B) TaxID=1356854 RepID=T0CTJ4_ALIAG|nr:hypothetical protein [Alicyclobacillus acidoterrestris]EPZ42732.1 hypothetical protein N007_14370 [Alicyclobacillus acidoterrestris ATCC 49025]UNO50115.1 hypothetical protein K1I37_06395 [Alicyclobacillus acidoterrestris]